MGNPERACAWCLHNRGDCNLAEPDVRQIRSHVVCLDYTPMPLVLRQACSIVWALEAERAAAERNA